MVPRRARRDITIPGTFPVPPHRLETPQIQFVEDIPEKRNDKEVALRVTIWVVRCCRRSCRRR